MLKSSKHFLQIFKLNYFDLSLFNFFNKKCRILKKFAQLFFSIGKRTDLTCGNSTEGTHKEIFIICDKSEVNFISQKITNQINTLEHPAE